MATLGPTDPIPTPTDTGRWRSTTKWIYSPWFDSIFIIGPSVLVTTIVLLFGSRIMATPEVPIWVFVFLVLGIDVAHVYSSLFRTYFDKEEFAKRRSLYLTVPLACWGVGAVLYAIQPMLFWIVLAYAAIWHFVRQQYGFFMLYRRGEAVPTDQTGPNVKWEYRLDQAAVYLSTFYPLVYWHTYPKAFGWFDQAEMFRIPTPWIEKTVALVYGVVLVAFLAKEIRKPLVGQGFNLGKVALLVATAASWYVGIVAFNGDLVFTIVNIVSHGVPYMALVWIYQYRKTKAAPHADGPKPANPFLRFFQWKFIPLYVLALFAIAYAEEWVWDAVVWQERADVFGKALAGFTPAPLLLVFLVPLLSMPQAAHYVLDAYIWRVNKGGGAELRKVIG